MRGRVLSLLLALMAPAQAEEVLTPQAYVVDRPELFADQVLWGVAHGARLLGLACAQANRLDAAEAWVEWQERESAQILGMNARLGQHYFQREDVPLDAIILALGLKSSLDLPPEILEPACATLREALAQPRYDLAKRREALLKP